MRNDYRIWYGVLVLLFVNIAVASAVSKQSVVDYLSVYFFNVGQGDSIYMRTPSGSDVLIDGGPTDLVLSKLGRVMPFSDRKIELMVLTHPHADHVAGLIEVLKRFEVERVFISDVFYNSETYKGLLSLLDQTSIEKITPRLGQRIYLDQDVFIDVLFPFDGRFERAPKDVNSVSPVLRLSFGQNNILLTGDTGKNIESVLLRAGLPLESEILKVGHQGSRTSSGERFVEAVQPDYAVISVGQNRYGHPHEEVLGILEKSGAEVLRTDELGDIVFHIYPDRIEKK